MPVSEFDLIKKYFASQPVKRDDVILGIGDDAALLAPVENNNLVIAMDTLVAGVHFPIQTSAYNIGYKVLAVNLSDLAAMGATPQWISLALTMPESDENWLKNFCAGLYDLAIQYNVQLIGGDVTRGPLTLTIQAHGYVEPDQALRRNAAQVGDGIYVSGALGDASIGLLCEENSTEWHNRLDTKAVQYFIDKLNKPTPRIELGLALKKIANAAIDVSDGIMADLNHILQQSQCGATIHYDKLPISEQAKQLSTDDRQTMLNLSAGDDYELCFTVPKNNQYKLIDISQHCNCQITQIGIIEHDQGLRCMSNGKEMKINEYGFKHF